MKQFVFLLVFISTLAFASAIPEYENRYVNDFADVLEPSDAELLYGLFTIVEENSSAQIVFVSVDNTEGYDISEYALLIGEEWGVGQEDVDNGIVILYSQDVKKIWVSTGYGLEGILPDSKIGRLLDETYVPLRDQGQVSEGIVEFSFALAEEITESSEEVVRKPQWVGVLLVIIILVVLVIFIYLVSQSNRRYYRSHGWGSTGYSGGSSFGGGSFGGGGAGR